jgi:hypothetical protein
MAWSMLAGVTSDSQHPTPTTSITGPSAENDHSYRGHGFERSSPAGQVRESTNGDPAHNSRGDHSSARSADESAHMGYMGSVAVDDFAPLRPIGSWLVWLQRAWCATMGVSLGVEALASLAYGASWARYAEQGYWFPWILTMADFMLTGILGVATLACLPVWVLWHVRARRNLDLLEIKPMGFEPIHHVIWWFVPLAQLVVPYFTMRELVVRSAPLGGDRHRVAPPHALGPWWGSWVFGHIVSGWIGMAALFADAAVHTWFVNYVATVVMVQAVYSYTDLVSWVTVQQEDRWRAKTAVAA